MDSNPLTWDGIGWLAPPVEVVSLVPDEITFSPGSSYERWHQPLPTTSDPIVLTGGPRSGLSG